MQEPETDAAADTASKAWDAGKETISGVRDKLKKQA
jgi:hypothetical protein